MAQAREEIGIWDRMRRRKVAQWSALYLAGGWGFLQGLQYVGEAFNWPGHLRQVAILALLIGLPIVIVLAWYHGDHGQQRVSAAEFAIITLLFVIGGSVFWMYDRQTSTPRMAAATPTASAPATAAKTRPADIRPSVAVLPFENRSRAEDDVFFVDGIHDDVLTQLSKISALRVISRTSVEQFRNTKLPIRTIAGQLGVGQILEGGVQRAGSRVRITVQLIDAATDAHLWAESYDRELTAANIFAIQSEVAAAIADALKTSLTSAERERVNTVPTQNLQAWERYQRGKQLMAQRTSSDMDEAEQHFRSAIALDPTFALAYVGLADSLNLQTVYSGATAKSNLAQADEAVSKALELEPELAEALASRALILANSGGDPVEMERLFRQALAINPNYATAHHWYSLFLINQGRVAEAIEHAERSAAIDPLSTVINANLAGVLAIAGRFDEAEAGYLKVLKIDQRMPATYSAIATIKAYVRNDFAAALRYQRKAVALDPGSRLDNLQLVAMLWDLGAYDELTRVVDAARSEWQRPDLFSTLTEAIASFATGDRRAGLASSLKSCELDPYCSALGFVVAADFEAGKGAQSRARIEKLHPELFERTPRVTTANYVRALLLAAVLQNLGDRERAAKLLDASEVAIQRMPRLGTSGYGVSDVAIHAMRGEKPQALAALAEAVRAGWRFGWRYSRDIDPTLASIRNEPGFKAAFAVIERDMARQRADIARQGEQALATVAP